MRPFHPYDLDLTVGLSRVLFPVVTLLGVSGIIVGILNSYDEFTIPALTPVAWNLAIILGLVLGVPRARHHDAKLYVYAVSILIGTVIQVLCRCRGCAAATTACGSSSTGAIRPSRRCSS